MTDLIRLSNNFSLQELVHPDIFKKCGRRSADFLSPFAVSTLQRLKGGLLGESIKINDWFWNGRFIDSGLRMPTGSVGAKLSSHRFGCGFDLKFKTISPIEVQEHIHARQDQYPNITRMEDAAITKTWLHLEFGVRAGDIYTFKP